MKNWQITSRGEPRFVVRIANCSQEHAESVFALVKNSPGCPDDLDLHEVEFLYDPPPRKSWWRKVISG